MRRFTVAIVCITTAGLLYVGQTVDAVKIGYTIRKQEERKIQLLDRARALKYNIARLKAPDTLERKLQTQRIVLSSPKSWQTLVMPGVKTSQRSGAAAMLAKPPFIGKWLVGTAQAEAKES